MTSTSLTPTASRIDPEQRAALAFHLSKGMSGALMLLGAIAATDPADLVHLEAIVTVLLSLSAMILARTYTECLRLEIEVGRPATFAEIFGLFVRHFSLAAAGVIPLAIFLASWAGFIPWESAFILTERLLVVLIFVGTSWSSWLVETTWLRSLVRGAALGATAIGIVVLGRLV